MALPLQPSSAGGAKVNEWPFVESRRCVEWPQLGQSGRASTNPKKRRLVLPRGRPGYPLAAVDDSDRLLSIHGVLPLTGMPGPSGVTTGSPLFIGFLGQPLSVRTRYGVETAGAEIWCLLSTMPAFCQARCRWGFFHPRAKRSSVRVGTVPWRGSATTTFRRNTAGEPSATS
jgi:hypothetical protein